MAENPSIAHGRFCRSGMLRQAWTRTVRARIRAYIDYRLGHNTVNPLFTCLNGECILTIAVAYARKKTTKMLESWREKSDGPIG